MIITIMGFALLQMQSNTIKSLDLLDRRLDVNKYSSFLFSNISKDNHKKEKTVYDFIKERYNIDDDDIIEYLKMQKYQYNQEEMFFLTFGENEDIDDEVVIASSESNLDEVGEDIKRVGLLVERVSIKDENNNSTSIFHFEYLQ